MDLSRADQILFAAECSTIAYQLDKPIPAELGLENVELLHDNNVPRGFMAKSKFGRIVAIKGTASLEDAETDASVTKAPFLNRFSVHSGFLREFNMVFPQVLEAAAGEAPVLFTGHSLGGGIATLLAMAFTVETHGESVAVTFGSPRVGDGTFARSYNKIVPSTVRVVHDKDLVPRVPKLFYEHVDRLHRITGDGRVLRAATNWLKEVFWFGKIVLADLDGEALDDHRMGNYLASVKAMRARVAKRHK